MATTTAIGGLQVTGSVTDEYRTVLTQDAMTFLHTLVERFGPRLDELLAARVAFQQRMDSGELPDFLPETRAIREGAWRVRDIPADLRDRRVEITGPVDRKMVINALNADVKVFMADFEDALAPTWDNVVQGQMNLRDANLGTISYANPDGRQYRLNERTALLICRVRGLHLTEKHVLWDQQGKSRRIPGCLFDFALYFFHSYRARMANGSGVYFYVPKLQSHQEARWWDDVFTFAEDHFAVPRGTVRATFLIETLPAVFQMHEILHALREHIVALNCGRWDYIFSYIKTLRRHRDRILPDRQVVTMDKPFLGDYSKLLIKTCHMRGAMAMGGMSAFIPSRDEERNRIALDKVREDKVREATNGHDGTWVAHPGLAGVANEVFGKHIPQGGENQLDVLRRDDPEVTAAQLLAAPTGARTEDGMRTNIRVSLQYIESWLSGIGAVAIHDLMEDAATAEISRASIWQWIQHGMELSNGKTVTKELFRQILKEELASLAQEVGEPRFGSGRFHDAGQLMDKLTTDDEFYDFLTLPAYEML